MNAAEGCLPASVYLEITKADLHKYEYAIVNAVAGVLLLLTLFDMDSRLGSVKKTNN